MYGWMEETRKLRFRSMGGTSLLGLVTWEEKGRKKCTRESETGGRRVSGGSGEERGREMGKKQQQGMEYTITTTLSTSRPKC